MGKEKGKDTVASDHSIIDIRAYKPKRISQFIWRESIYKIWEVDPLTCPKCAGEMKIKTERRAHSPSE